MTIDQARQYLDELGISLPDFILEALIKTIQERDECLNENYSKATVLLIYCYLLSLMATAQSGRYISSQSLPSGLGRSFRYKDDKALWVGQLGLLKGIDTKGCVTDLIPDDPFQSKKAFAMTFSGGCYE